MMQHFHPLALESIDMDLFPDIALFVKQGTQHVLYKGSDAKLTEKEITRLHSNNVEFVYISKNDIGVVQKYLETNLKGIFSNEDISIKAKNATLVPLMINCVSETFKNPDKPEYFHKCRHLLQQLVFQVTDRIELFEMLKMAIHNEVYLFTHSTQVAILSMFIHQKLFNVEHDEMIDIGIGSLLHDIGMTAVSGYTLEKTDTLSPREYYRIRHHPHFGHDMMVKMGVTEPLPLTIVLSHHERYNGTGYPNHLFENEIPRSAQVAAICDVYCALTSERPYRSSSSSADALKLIKSESRLFHPEILDEFIVLLEEKKP